MENKLISMTDFVLNSAKDQKHRRDKYDDIYSYADFLKQPLALWMFVPVDENNLPLEEPIYSITNYGASPEAFKRFEEDRKKFEQAKSRVIFEGFKLLSDYNGMYRLRNAQNIDITFDSYGCYAEPFDSIPGKRINTIEEITYLDLTLTETAIKQIYGS
ncbi:hypothetical protein CQS02_20075 [Elizabethkingia miricola]|nr:hypothetical protein CQS02_20075 [Elizabethkingia miricola]